MSTEQYAKYIGVKIGGVISYPEEIIGLQNPI